MGVLKARRMRPGCRVVAKLEIGYDNFQKRIPFGTKGTIIEQGPLSHRVRFEGGETVWCSSCELMEAKA